MYTIGLPHMTPETYGPSQGLALEVHHLFDQASGAFSGLLAKNRRRGRAAAAKLAAGIDRIELYNASLLDDCVKNSRKIRMLARHPLLALIVIPAWGFLYWYFGQGFFKAGRIGLRDALNLPLYYAAFALNMIRLRRKPEPDGGHREDRKVGSE